MKIKYNEILPKLINPNNEKNFFLSDEDINYYINHKLFRHLFLTKEEAIGNILSLKKIIIDEENCEKKENECFSESKYHLGIKRNINGQLNLYVYYCNKIEKIEEKLSFKKNFIYNYYSKSDISNVQLTKEYFSKSDKSLQDIVNDYKNIISISNSRGMYIYGSFGVGKTYLSFALANDLAIKKNFKICFVFLQEYINVIKKGFNNDDFKSYANKLTTAFEEADALFIDDIGSENSSEWFYIEYLLKILNIRMIRNKMTFFTSNLNLDELEKSFQFKFKDINSKTPISRLMDRIRALVDNKQYLLKGTNKRY